MISIEKLSILHLLRSSRTYYEFGSKQGLDEVDKMGVEVLLIFFVEPFEVGKSQDEDFFAVPGCPVINELENSLFTTAELVNLNIVSIK